MYAIAAAGLAACGGGGSKAFVGVTDITVDASGAVAGVSGQSLAILDSDAGSFAHGFLQGVDATVIGNSGGSASGDTGSFAVSGIVDDYNVGSAYVSGTASYSGAYAMTVVSGYERSANPANWEQETFSGTFDARIELHTALTSANDPGHGHSHDFDVVELFGTSDDGRISFDEVVIYSPTPPAQPSTLIHRFEGGEANLGGDPVPLRGQVAFGSDGMIASFQGQDAENLVAGGFGLDGAGFVTPAPE